MVHQGVVMLDGRVSGEEDREAKVAVEVKDGELMMFDEWWGSEERRQRGGVSYSPPEQTLCVSTPTWLSRSLLWPSILSIRSRTCGLTEHHSGVGSSRSRTLPLLL